MDRQGIDVHVISVHPSQFLYFTEPALAARIVKMQNEKIAELVAAHRDRFVGFGNVSLQQPALAVEQELAARDDLFTWRDAAQHLHDPVLTAEPELHLTRLEMAGAVAKTSVVNG